MSIQLARTPKKTKPRVVARPSPAKKEGSGVYPDYGNLTRTHAEEGQTERSGQAERSENGCCSYSSLFILFVASMPPRSFVEPHTALFG